MIVLCTLLLFSTKSRDIRLFHSIALSLSQVLQAGSFHCIPNKPGSMGKPAPGMDLRVSCSKGQYHTSIIGCNVGGKLCFQSLKHS